MSSGAVWNPRQKGNALFLVLIAVALFAALSYAITQSSRGGGTSGREQDSLVTAQIIDYAATIHQAVTRLTLISGCTESTLNFAANQWGAQWASYKNNSAPGDKSCDVFDAAGGNVAWQAPPAGAGAWQLLKNGLLAYQFNGETAVSGSGTTVTPGACSQTTSAGTDLMIIVSVTQSMCISVNNQFGITNPGGLPPATWVNITPNGWWGSAAFASGQLLGAGLCAAADAAFLNHPTGCYQRNSDQAYFFYSVLLAR